MTVQVLGVDPGFANLGFAVVTLSQDGGLVPTRMGVFQTDKSAIKRNVLASDDNVRRAREISKFLRELLKSAGVRAICAETMSFPRSSSVAAKMAMAWGVVASLSEELDIPILQATPQGLKLAVAADRSASKEDIQKALEKQFGKKLLAGLVRDTTPSKQEHPFDALGAVVACSDSEVLRLARRMSNG